MYSIKYCNNFCETFPEALVYHQQQKLMFLKALHYIRLKGRSESNSFKVGALIYSGKLNETEIRESLELTKQSYKDAVKQLKRWFKEWLRLTIHNGENEISIALPSNHYHQKENKKWI